MRGMRYLMMGALLVGACAASDMIKPALDLSSDLAASDMTSDLAPACSEDAPGQCLDTPPADERGLLNACSGPDVAVVLRPSRVPAELWRPGCPLPPL